MSSNAGRQGLATDTGSVKYRFAYKIRVENVSEDLKSTVQLLGRTWIIEEDEPEEGNLKYKDESDRIVHVKAPTTGAVGHLPVLRPGEIFEYISGCELSTETGNMSGCLHFAFVDPHTESAQVGDPIDAFQLPEDKHFEIPVEPFNLIAE
jgi:ApaG protein